MNVKLINQIPAQDGYFLFKIKPEQGIHLVLLQTDLSGFRTLSLETMSINIDKAHEHVFKDAIFSEEPITVSV